MLVTPFATTSSFDDVSDDVIMQFSYCNDHGCICIQIPLLHSSHCLNASIYGAQWSLWADICCGGVVICHWCKYSTCKCGGLHSVELAPCSVLLCTVRAVCLCPRSV